MAQKTKILNQELNKSYIIILSGCRILVSKIRVFKKFPKPNTHILEFIISDDADEIKADSQIKGKTNFSQRFILILI